ncbi:MAG: diguanylate cyclase [Steroidobacteraceae bacterium]
MNDARLWTGTDGASGERLLPARQQLERTSRRGFHLLRFDGPLEAEFLAAHRDELRSGIRLNIFLALVTVIGFSWLDHALLSVTESMRIGPTIARFGLQLPIVLACLVLTSPRLYRWYWPVIYVGAPLFALGHVTMVANASDLHAALIAARIVLVSFFFYFMLGLPFLIALAVNLIFMLSFAAAAAIGYVPPAIAGYILFVQFCANLFAGAGSYALERANRLNFLERRLLREVATHDGLTGLQNRGAFELQVRTLWDQLAREGQAVTVLLLDIDHFKAFNDRYGHQAGDGCLRDVATAVRRAARRRPFDLVARYGGEELIVVLPGADARYGDETALALVEAVRDLKIPHVDSPTRPCVTVSVGFVCIRNARESTFEAALRQADEALYRAKDEGRDRHAKASRSPAATAPAGVGIRRAAS